MAICPSCMTKYPDRTVSCVECGSLLVPEEAFAYVDKDLVPGDQVGEYRIEGKLGEGGFGAVFRAIHPVIGKHAAVKVLNRQFSANPQMVSRFIAEARAVNQIRHRNIIDIFAFGQLSDGRQYYVMELLEGRTMDAYLSSQKRLSLAQALPILRGITRALDAAHGKGIVHRDLKPENVFLVFDEDGGVEAKLLDFGLVKLLGGASSGGEHHKTKTGTPMGTPYYMSPEQCRGLDVDRRTDIYSFGALVYQTLTGEVPFDGGSPMDVLLKHMTQDPPSASQHCADVPPDLDEPIRLMMAKEQNERPQSVGQAFESLVAAGNAAGILGGQGHLPVPTMGPAPFHGMATLPTQTPPLPLPPAKAASPNGQTFLPAEADVAEAPRTRGRAGVMIGVIVLACAAVGAFAMSMRATKKDAPSGLVATPASSAAITTPALPATSPTSSSEMPADVDITIEGAPEGALVKSGDKELGVAPGPFKMKPGATVVLTITAKGYKPREVTFTPNARTTVPVTLERAPAVTTTAPKATGKGKALSPDLEGFDPKQ